MPTPVVNKTLTVYTVDGRVQSWTVAAAYANAMLTAFGNYAAGSQIVQAFSPPAGGTVIPFPRICRMDVA